jgi:hypothetical protein
MDSGIQRSYDCPECGQAAFIVVRRPESCAAQLSVPMGITAAPPDGSREGGPVSDDACDG